MYRYLSFLLLLELCSPYKADPQGCGYNKGSDGLYYKFHNKNVNWETANATCDGEGAHLAIYFSRATYEYIKNTYSIHMRGIWIGARDTNSRNDWRWLLNQRPVEKTYWQTGEPNNYQGTQEDCGMINYIDGPGRLHDAPCSWTGPKFLCQKEYRECINEEGYCVSNGRDVATTRLDGVMAGECLKRCLTFPNAKGCSLVQENHAKKCYVATEDVTGGNGVANHTCWIISKCVGKGSLAPTPQTGSSCKPYHCYRDKAQMGYDISYRKANTLDACSQHCCQMSQCGCIGFDWRGASHECWLSQTPRVRVPTSKAKGIYSCEFKDIPAGYKKGLGSFYKLYRDRVDWNTAKIRCLEDGAQLVVDDSNEKHDYLVKTYNGQTYWVHIRDLQGIWKYEEERRVQNAFWDRGQPERHGRDEACVAMWHTGLWHGKSCSESRWYICEIKGMAVTTHDDEVKNNNAFIPLVIIGLGCVVVFIAVRAFIHHKNRLRTRAAVSPPSPTGSGDQVISNEMAIGNVDGSYNQPVPKSLVTNGIAVLPEPPQYHELYPSNNNNNNDNMFGEVPPPPYYTGYNNGYTGNSTNVP